MATSVGKMEIELKLSDRSQERLRRASAAHGFRANLLESPEGDVLELFIYDQISPWGVNASDVVQEIVAAKSAKAIRIYINSPGGDVFDAAAIYNALMRHPAPVAVDIDGLAASSASWIAMAGDTIRIGAGGFLMIHNPWGMMAGDSTEFRKYADLLDQIRGRIAAIYAARSGNDLDQITQWMDAETWLDGEQAKAAGFVDEIQEPAGEVAADTSQNLADRFDLRMFRRVPEPLAEDVRLAESRLSVAAAAVSRLPFAPPDTSVDDQLRVYQARLDAMDRLISG